MTVRWGIVGCGNVCEVKSGPGFQKAEKSELVAVMRRDGDLAEDYARRHGVPKWYADADRLIEDPDVTVVYVATPVGSHMEHALRVCRAGKPCYVEKPMARSHEECARMVEAFEKAGLPLFVAYYRRALARFLKAKEIVESGRIGKLTMASYRLSEPRHLSVNPQELPWRLVAEHSGGGAFMDLGSHTLDILDFILGPLREVSGEAANVASPYGVEDMIAMRFRTRTGALGSARWNFATAVREDMIQIEGTDGRISLSTFATEPVRLDTASGGEEFDIPNPEHVQEPLIQTIVNELSGGGECPSTGASAARTALVMDKVLESYYGSRSGAFWERPERWPGRRRS